MVYELQKPQTDSSRTLVGYYMKCSRCGYRAPVRPGDTFGTKAEAEQEEKSHNLTAHGIAPKGFRP